MHLHFLNETWVTEDKLTISVFDLSVIRGFGVFDFLRTYNSKPFKLPEHIDRLFHSAKQLGITIPQTKKEIGKIVFEGIEKNKFPETNVRIVVTGGVTPDGITPGKSSFIVMFTKAINYPVDWYKKGVKIITYPHVRAFPEAKSLNYLTAVVALQEAKKRGAIEALFIDQNGKLYEGTTTNFFAIIDDKLVTPKGSILPGITKQIVIQIAKKLKIPLVERNVFMNEIQDFDEAFITASNKEVMSVVKINENVIVNGRVGKTTNAIMHEFRALTRKE